MSNIRPKELLQQAQEEETNGRARPASVLYARVGIHLVKSSRWSEAEVILNRAVKLSRRSARVFLYLARCEQELGKEALARQSIGNYVQIIFSKRRVAAYTLHLETELSAYPVLRQFFYEAVLKIDRTSAEPFLALARAFRGQRNWARAREVLLDALKTKTHPAQVLELLRAVIVEQGNEADLEYVERYEEHGLSRDELATLLGIGPANKPPPPEVSGLPRDKSLKDLISELEAEIGVSAAESSDAVAVVVKEFRSRADAILLQDAKARIDMGLAFFEMGLYEDARGELAEVRTTDARFLEAQCLLGQILMTEGSDLGALEIYQQCLRVENASYEIIAESRYQMAQIYLRLGDLAQAMENLKEVEKRVPGYRDVKTIRFQLEELLEGPFGKNSRRHAR